MAQARPASTTIVNEAEWNAALRELQAKEDAHFDAAEALHAERRKLPNVEITTPYTFVTPDGPRQLADLFNGHPQLVLYHFMFAPEWENGCPNCTKYANSLGRVQELQKLGTELAFVSRAPLGKIEAYKAKMGWDIPWYSCETGFSEAMGALPGGSDIPAINVFVPGDAGKVYRTYSTNGRPILTTWGHSGLLNLTPAGSIY